MTNNYQKEAPGRQSFKQNDISNNNSKVRLIISFKMTPQSSKSINYDR